MERTSHRFFVKSRDGILEFSGCDGLRAAEHLVVPLFDEHPQFVQGFVDFPLFARHTCRAVLLRQPAGGVDVNACCKVTFLAVDRDSGDHRGRTVGLRLAFLDDINDVERTFFPLFCLFGYTKLVLATF